MERRTFASMFGSLAVLRAIRPERVFARARRAWSFTADIAECCSCAIPCSCNFGRPERVCRGTRLIQIREGMHEGEDLGGINFAVTFDRTHWTRIYIDHSMSPARLAAVERLLPVAFGGFDGQAAVKERVPLTVRGTADTFAFSVPESTVEMRMLPGLDGGAIVITGLPSTAYHEYVQYESVVHDHASASGSWSHSGTNGFRSVMRASG